MNAGYSPSAWIRNRGTLNLYSLSINPDQGLGELTRAKYRDYVDRVEKKLGLEGQPRAIVFHIKEGREDCHVVWSRIDYQTRRRFTCRSTMTGS
ncbi:relaxase/mobilization nuclease domain-containing protein [Methylocella silvestris]|uniref:MobA/VirD2-like nuclease domain-containing protein n=1 Tax=Methylocella silvestris TaxID=199596 RepID=A0A2J7TCA8_METSI|nr:hypothetical protein [Methylocella silvestris]PNG24398.1 hypothetical protein CR492_18750 [Methylocella silvestris]